MDNPGFIFPRSYSVLDIPHELTYFPGEILEAPIPVFDTQTSSESPKTLTKDPEEGLSTSHSKISVLDEEDTTNLKDASLS